MSTFGEKSVYELENSDAKHLKSLNERFVRWQEKQIVLLTFSINLIFSFSIATIGLVINNFDKTFFQNKYFFQSPLPQTIIVIIAISALFGIFALFFRLLDFRLTKTLVRSRILLFKVKNKIKYENSKEINQNDLDKKINKLTCSTKILGNVTWCFFLLQTLIFITGIMIAVLCV